MSNGKLLDTSPVEHVHNLRTGEVEEWRNGQRIPMNVKEALQCKCGCVTFWCYDGYVKCSQCFSDYKLIEGVLYRRLYNDEKHDYEPWEEVKKIGRDNPL